MLDNSLADEGETLGTETLFYRRVLRMPWAEHVINVKDSRKIKTQGTFGIRIRKRQL